MSPRIRRGRTPKQKKKTIKAFVKNIDFAWGCHWLSMKKRSKNNENQHQINVFAKNYKFVRIFIVCWHFFHWKSMPLSSEINVFAESLDFLCFLFCLGVLPLWILELTCSSHIMWHVLRSSSSWVSQIYLDASGVSPEGVWGWSWIAKPDILRMDLVSCRYTCIEYVLWCPFRWASPFKQLWLNGNETGKQIAAMWKAMGMWSTIHPSWDGPKPD